MLNLRAAVATFVVLVTVGGCQRGETAPTLSHGEEAAPRGCGSVGGGARFGRVIFQRFGA